MNTDTDRIEALEALIHRTELVNGKEVKVSSDMFISGGWGECEHFMLYLRKCSISGIEKALSANSLRQLADKLIEYNQVK
jgi:hypothetical protein